MQTLADLDLPDLPVETPEFAEDPHRFFRDARKKHPWLAKSSIGLLIHEYTAIRELLGKDDKFLPAYARDRRGVGRPRHPLGTLYRRAAHFLAD